VLVELNVCMDRGVVRSQRHCGCAGRNRCDDAEPVPVRLHETLVGVRDGRVGIVGPILGRRRLQ
jgi:hypothetical protein